MSGKRSSRGPAASYAEEDGEEEIDLEQGERKRPRRAVPAASGRVAGFVQSTWDLCADPTNAPLVEWSPDGSYVTIKDEKAFAERVLPHYFKHNKWSSFSRNLNLYGFTCPRGERGTRRFMHADFVRDRPELLPRISREKKHSRGGVHHDDDDDDDDDGGEEENGVAQPQHVFSTQGGGAAGVSRDDVLNLITALRCADARMHRMEAMASAVMEHMAGTTSHVYVDRTTLPPRISGKSQGVRDERVTPQQLLQVMLEPASEPLQPSFQCEWRHVMSNPADVERLYRVVKAVTGVARPSLLPMDSEDIVVDADAAPPARPAASALRVPLLRSQPSVRDDFTSMLPPDARVSDSNMDLSKVAAAEALARMGSFAQPEEVRIPALMAMPSLSEAFSAPAAAALPLPVAMPAQPPPRSFPHSVDLAWMSVHPSTTSSGAAAVSSKVER